ncbi:hypothetical protein OUZ56_024608 [Daphnia magna]|uniref:Uncharacterized protein n=1 Tax=Daphnia magna TaxID=35525 RepID=A0ABR0AHE0_9CRUS|nr:hypothetical protein OUZ56_009964 [Daphnia magna]KAK4031082.1 hypothetical protein OUZ56_024608 [Daphnia magna]
MWNSTIANHFGANPEFLELLYILQLLTSIGKASKMAVENSFPPLCPAPKSSKFQTFRPTKRGIGIPLSLNQPGFYDSGKLIATYLVRFRHSDTHPLRYYEKFY